jgi:tRNA(Ile)-lysidine synthase
MARSPLLDALAACPVWDGLSRGTVVVACSGGPDSTAMACAVRELLDDMSFNVRFAVPPRLMLWHLDHQLRSQSGADAAFVRRLAEDLGVRAVVERVDVGAEQRERGGNMEQVARMVRYEHLLALLGASETGEAGTLKVPARALTAHHLADQAETVLFRLARGAHLRGLRGILPVRDGVIYRPWLSITPDAIREYLAVRGQAYVTDPTNVDRDLARNAIRHEVLPVLSALNPQVREHLAGLALAVSRIEQVIESALSALPVKILAAQVLADHLPVLADPQGTYEVHFLEAGWGDPALLLAYLSRMLRAAAPRASRMHYGELDRWCTEGASGPLHLCGLSFSLITSQAVALACAPSGATPPPGESEFGLGEAVCAGLRVSLEEGSGGPANEIHTRRPQGQRTWPAMVSAIVDGAGPRHWSAALPGGTALPLRLRPWRAGDRVPLKAGGTKKAGDIFTDAKIPSCFRTVWVVVADRDDHPLWVPGLSDPPLPAGTQGEAEVLRLTLTRQSTEGP